MTALTALGFTTGDIQDLKLPSLSKLHLGQTNVTGDIKAFHSKKEIVYLDLADTQAHLLRIPMPFL